MTAKPTAGITPTDDDSLVLKAFVIIRGKGCTPEKKGPFPPDMVEAFVREVMHHRPDAEIAVCELTWDLDLWVRDGREMIAIANLFAAPRRRRRKTATLTSR